jgi:hypothetical protein
MKPYGDLWWQVYRACSAVERRGVLPNVAACAAVLRSFRSVRRQQINRDNVEHSDLGGEA